MATKSDSTTKISLNIQLTDATVDDKLESLHVALFDRNGRAVARTSLKVAPKGAVLVAEGSIEATDAQLQSGRLVVAPVVGASGDAPLTRERLEKQFGGFTAPLQIDIRNPKFELKIPRPYWEHWPLLCACWIRGRLVKRVQLPDGQVVDLPVCHSRVKICEVDRWPLIIARLPWTDILRLRDDLLALVEHRLPIPEPGPDPFPHPIFGDAIAVRPAAMLRSARLPVEAQQRIGVARDVHLQANVMSNATHPALAASLHLSQLSDVTLRAELLKNVDLWRPYFCWLPWLEPWFVYTKQCFGPIETDEQGRFSFVYIHQCDGDQPDIYISAEQLLGGSWTTIHAPPVRCHTIWNYHCGDEITVVVHDPRAQPCIPDVPTETPPGIDRWVMPMAIGATWIRGAGAIGPTPDGWVRPDGMTNYGAIVDAPFGGTLGFRQQHSLSIPNVGANGQYYYVWSHRRGTSGSWAKMIAPVSRTYVRDVPGPGVQFPAVQLGPQPGELFRFKPVLFNPADWGVSTVGDPAGTQYYWPVDNSIGDIYASRWTTPGADNALTAPGLADNYQVKLEVFDSLGNLVMPSATTFTFVVPENFVGDTLNTRVALPTEMDGAGFVFTVLVDNSRCGANIAPPTLSTGVGVDDCGFLRYTPGTTLTLAFDATHPHNRATFSFNLIRGTYGVSAASTAGEVGALVSGAYSGSGNGNFSHAFPVATLLGPLPGHPDTCVNAAFAADLDLDAKATDGNSRLWIYDASFLRAFALALATDEE